MLRSTVIFCLAIVVSMRVCADTDVPLVQRLEAAVFKVETFTSQGNGKVGSAVLISDGRLVTNCHVTRGAHRIDLVHGPARWPAALDAIDSEHDLCILTAPGLRGTPAEMAPVRTLRVGEAVLAAGYPGGASFIVSHGLVRGLHLYDGSRVVQTSAPFSPGASGGGLFDVEGRLVGILTFKTVTGGAFHFALPSDWIMHMAPGGTALAPPSAGSVAFWEREGRRQPWFMRAAALEVEHNWSALLNIARSWLKAESSNPQCWIAAGLAHFHLKQPNDAMNAFRHATALDPDAADMVRPFTAMLDDSRSHAECLAHQHCP